MTRFLAHRLLQMIPVLLGVLFLTFAIQQITPGDPVRLMLGPRVSQEQVDAARQQLGLNDPFLVQFGRYIANAVRGDFGKSIRGQQDVLPEILRRFPATAELTLAAMFFAVLIGVPIGVLAATSSNKATHGIAMGFALFGLSVPSFWLAILLILIFGVQLKWVSVTGGAGLQNLILPAITLGLAPAAVIARLTRSSVLEVFREDYVRVARAKGLLENVVIIKHVLRNALIPVVTVIGLQFAALLGGAVFIENVFARNGLGRYAVQAVAARDFPVVQGTTLFFALIYVIVNLVIDVLYSVLNPRIRLGMGR